MTHEQNSIPNPCLQDYPCKNCGKEFTRPEKGRPKVFCSDDCRRIWSKKQTYRIKRIRRNHSPQSSSIYLRPVFRKEPDMDRLCRAIIAMALETDNNGDSS